MLLLGHYGRLKNGQANDTFDTDYLSLGLKYRPHLYAVLLAQAQPVAPRRAQPTPPPQLRDPHRRARRLPRRAADPDDSRRRPRRLPRVHPPLRPRTRRRLARATRSSRPRRQKACRSRRSATRPSAGGRARCTSRPIFASQDPYALRDGTPATARPREQGPLPVTEALRGRLMTLPCLHQGARALRPPMRPSIAQGGRRRGRGDAIRTGRRGGSHVMFARSGCLQRSALMTTWLKPVRDALDNAHAPVPVFIRDDDAGWDDERLIGLLDLLAGLGLPVDLAAIPTRAGPGARPRAVRADRRPRRPGRHPPARAGARQPRARRAQGRVRLLAVGRRPAPRHRAPAASGSASCSAAASTPIFTPPWNRCTRRRPLPAWPSSASACSRATRRPGRECRPA